MEAGEIYCGNRPSPLSQSTRSARAQSSSHLQGGQQPSASSGVGGTVSLRTLYGTTMPTPTTTRRSSSRTVTRSWRMRLAGSHPLLACCARVSSLKGGHRHAHNPRTKQSAPAPAAHSRNHASLHIAGGTIETLSSYGLPVGGFWDPGVKSGRPGALP